VREVLEEEEGKRERRCEAQRRGKMRRRVELIDGR
jgi:hypothetical protein